jgi:hypothetical protein
MFVLQWLDYNMYLVHVENLGLHNPRGQSTTVGARSVCKVVVINQPMKKQVSFYAAFSIEA